MKSMLLKIRSLIKTLILLKRSQDLLNLASLFCIMVKCIGVWNDFKNGKIYVSSDYIKETNRIFALTLSDLKPNVMMIQSLRKYTFWKNFIENFNIGIVYFENQEIKHSTFNAISIYKSY